MAPITETYRGFTIVIDEAPPEDAASRSAAEGASDTGTGAIRPIKINDTEIAVEATGPGTYVTDYLPYTSYSTVLDLAKAVIDHTEEFANASAQ